MYIQKAEVTLDRCDVMESGREEKLSSKVQEVCKSTSEGMRAEGKSLGHSSSPPKLYIHIYLKKTKGREQSG